MGKDMTRFVKRKPLREVLVEQGLVAGPQLDAVLGKLEDGRRPLGQALVAEGLLSAEQLGRALAAQYGLSYEPLTEYRVDPRFYQTIPVELMYRIRLCRSPSRMACLSLPSTIPAICRPWTNWSCC